MGMSIVAGGCSTLHHEHGHTEKLAQVTHEAWYPAPDSADHLFTSGFLGVWGQAFRD